MVMQQIPVYAFTGFLDSGKTKFIQETLEDPRFNAGERTLVLIFEEGEEEYDLSTYPKKNVYLEVLDQQTVTTEELKALQKKYKAERVVAELNAIAQEVMFADATTFMTYNANMRNLVMDKLMGAQMVVFNRMAPGQDVMPFHKLARAANRRIDILYDYTDGTTKFDEIEDPLPFDINAPVIEIKDEDYALWYRDVTEEPEKYVGKTVCFKDSPFTRRKLENAQYLCADGQAYRITELDDHDAGWLMVTLDIEDATVLWDQELTTK